MKKIICLGGLLLTMMVTVAQKKSSRPRYPPHQTAITFNPLALVNTDMRFMAGLEQRLSLHWSAGLEVAPVLHSSYLENIKRTGGFELRPALRYYFGRQATDYVQLQVQYRNVAYRLHDWLGKACVAGVPAYEQLQDFTYRKQQLGGAFVFGSTERLGRHWLMDISVGLGFQYRTHGVSSEEGCCYVSRRTVFGEVQQEEAWIPVIPISVKLGYVVK